MMSRNVQPELLDELSAADPEAQGSRRDLKLLNRIMGHAGIFSMAWKECGAAQWGARIVDLGGGDATLLLDFARRIHNDSKARAALLVDRRPSVSVDTLQSFEAMGWQLDIASNDVFEWLADVSPMPNTFIMANLFLHHFEREALQRLLNLITDQSRGFAACEPRRSNLSLGASRLLGLIGCNRVTRHDAVISVRAGFRGRELQELWAPPSDWRVIEREAGLFSHLLCGSKTNQVL